MRVLATANVQDVQALAFAPDGARLAAAAPGHGVTAFDLAGGAVVCTGSFGFRWHTVLGFEPDGVLTATTSDGRTRFDPASGARLDAGPHDPDAPGEVASFAETDGTRVVTVQSRYKRTRVMGWVRAGGGWEQAWGVDVGHTSDPAVTAAGDRVATVTNPQPRSAPEYQLIVRDTVTGETVGVGRYPYTQPGHPRFRPDGDQVVVAHQKKLIVWNAGALDKPVQIPADTRHHFTAAAYHPSGRYLFTTSNDATVTVWDTDSWVRAKRFDWDVGRLRSVAVSPDGLLAAAGSDRGRVVVWDVDV